MAYISQADLATYLNVETDDDDALLGQIRTRAQAAIDAYCRRTFEASVDSTRTFDAVRDVHGRYLMLDEDLCAITTVTNGDSVEVSAGEYTTEPRNRTPYYSLRLLASSGKAWTFQTDPEDAISIAGRWAYSTTAPDDIKHATVRLCAFIYRQRDTGTDVDRPILAGDGTVIMPSALPSDVRMILNPYRRVLV